MSRVLIVDDYHPTCDVMARIVQSAGHNAECAYGGTEALASLGNAVPDLVILDYMMPDISGLDVLREIRRDARTADVPVVMFSAVADTSIQSYAKAQGANDYWIKGTIDYEKIRAGLARLIPPSAAA